MSSLIVEVCAVEEIAQHPNADRLAVYKIKGWQVVDQIGKYVAGDLCVYFPPETVLPGELADRLGVTKYLKPLPKERGVRPPGGRIRVASLRGVRSYGLAIKPDDPAWPAGTDVVAHYGVTKFEMPETCTDGDARKQQPGLLRYTDIENYRNFPGVFVEGEEVVMSEKIHGKNCRLAYLRTANEADGSESFQFHCASNKVNRKEFNENGTRSDFWAVLTDNIRSLLTFLSDGDTKNVICFGELYGAGVQDMWYGGKPGELFFRCFDINVDGKFIDFDDRIGACAHFGVPHAPILFRGPFSVKTLESLTDGPTSMCLAEEAGDFRGREGVVVLPVKERCDRQLRNEGRVILKSVSFDYLNRRGETTEYH